MDPLLADVFTALSQAGVCYCVLRGHDRLDAVEEGDVDLLVEESQLGEAAAVLAALGFVRLRAWGRSPHHFFVAYDGRRDRWLKLDIVTRIAYGRPFHVWQTRMADGLLAHRQPWRNTWIPSPEDEFVTLLLHCVVDKGQFPAHWGERLKQLAGEVRDDARLASALLAYWGNHMAPEDVVALVRAEAWEKLLAARPLVVRHLARRGPLGAMLRRWRDWLARKAQVLVGLVRPQHPDVALLAPDGAGKSTLAVALQETFFFPVHVEYMGLYQKGARRSRHRLPGLGLLAALWTQWRRYARARLYRARGHLVLFDRYTYDALLVQPTRREGLLRRLRRRLLAHACPAPNLVLLLDAPGQVLFQRKREHSPGRLEQQRQQYLTVTERLPHAVILDAMADPETVRRAATAHIWALYKRSSRERTYASYAPAYRSASSADQH